VIVCLYGPNFVAAALCQHSEKFQLHEVTQRIIFGAKCNFYQNSSNLPSWSHEVKGSDKTNVLAGGQH
jgi:hypothetical protein